MEPELHDKSLQLGSCAIELLGSGDVLMGLLGRGDGGLETLESGDSSAPRCQLRS